MGKSSQEDLDVALASLEPASVPSRELRERLLLIGRRWRLGLGWFLFTVVVVMVLPIMPAPMYEVSSAVLIGVATEGIDPTLTRLRDEHVLTEAIRQAQVHVRPGYVADRLRVQELSGGGLRLSVRSRTREEGERLVSALSRQLLTVYEPRIQSLMSSLEDRRYKLGVAAENVNNQLDELRQGLHQVLQRSPDPSTWALLSVVSVKDRVEALIAIDREIREIDVKLASIDGEGEGTHVTARRLSAWSGPLQRVFIATLLGLFVALTAMLLAERLDLTSRKSP